MATYGFIINTTELIVILIISPLKLIPHILYCLY